jgi:hypothetical protein
MRFLFRLTVRTSQESDRKKSIAQHSALNGNPPLKLVLPSELYIYIWSKNFSHSVNEKSEAK